MSGVIYLGNIMRKILLGFVCLLIAITGVSLKIACASWCVEAVDARKDFDHWTIALDGNNNPHIPYWGDHFYYTYYDGSTWHYETVNTTPEVNSISSFVLDPEGKAHISYRDKTDGDLKYATNKSGYWVVETVDSEGSIYPYTPLALDSDGKAHISYSYYDSYFGYGLKYATNTSGDWVVETVDGGGGTTEVILDSALDSDKKVHIIHPRNGYLTYTTNKSGSWISETVDNDGYAQLLGSLVLDQARKAYISYQDQTNRVLKYATNKSGAWVKETVDGPVTFYTSISVALDSEGKVHIGYSDYNNNNEDLKYATNESGAWVKETINESYENAVQCSSLLLDSDGKAHISYSAALRMG